MDRREIKKLLIDLDLTVGEIAARTDLSRAAVYKYFDGKLQRQERRVAIQGVLRRRGRQIGVRVPELWPSEATRSRAVARLQSLADPLAA